MKRKSLKESIDYRWQGFDILKGEKAEAFKDYLRDNDYLFEPSEDGKYIHIEVYEDEDTLNKIKDVFNSLDDIEFTNKKPSKRKQSKPVDVREGSHYYFDLKDVLFIWHGQWADPELEYKNKLYSYNEVGEWLWNDFEEAIKYGDITLKDNEDKQDEFIRFIGNNKDLIYDALDNLDPVDELEESKKSKRGNKVLKEGTSNFSSSQLFPLLAFELYDDVIAIAELEFDKDYPNIEDFENEDDYYNAIFEFEEKAIDNAPAQVLTDEEISELEEDIDDFNTETRDIANDLYDEGNQDDYWELRDIKVEIEPGVYEGAQLIVKNESEFKYLSEKVAKEQLKRFYDFLNEMKKKYNLTQLSVSARFSNGETFYNKVEEARKSKKRSALIREGVELKSPKRDTYGEFPYYSTGDTYANELLDDIYSDIMFANSNMKMPYNQAFEKYFTPSNISYEDLILLAEYFNILDIDDVYNKVKIAFIDDIIDGAEQNWTGDAEGDEEVNKLKKELGLLKRKSSTYSSKKEALLKTPTPIKTKKETTKEVKSIKKDKKLKEGYIGQTVEDFLDSYNDDFDTIIIDNVNDEDSNYEGFIMDIPTSFSEADFNDFDCTDLTINASSNTEGMDSYYESVGDFLDDYNTDDIFKVWSNDESKVIFEGTKDELPEEIAQMYFNTFECSNLVINASVETEDYDDDIDWD